jgi:predicted nucleic acid-binding protein
MTKVFLDTNIIIDFLAKREPFYIPAAEILEMASRDLIQIIVSALSIPTVHYILSKIIKDRSTLMRNLRNFKTIVEISDLTDGIIERGFNSDISDFEDALQYNCALDSNCEVVITRNVKDYKTSKIPVMDAENYVKLYFH